MKHDALSEINIRKRFQRQNNRVIESSEDSLSNDSSIMNIQPNDDYSYLGKTFQVAKPVDKTSLGFWFKRSDFYVTGMDFVFSRIALMCQSTAITFYLQLVCGF